MKAIRGFRRIEVVKDIPRLTLHLDPYEVSTLHKELGSLKALAKFQSLRDLYEIIGVHGEFVDQPHKMISTKEVGNLDA